MGPGIFLAVVGAILAFAVRADPPGVDLQVVGLILMIAGAAVIVHARSGTRRERTITRVEDPHDPNLPTHTVQKSITDRDVG